MPFGITGQSSRSSSNQTTITDGTLISGRDSGNVTETSVVETTTADAGGIIASGNVTLTDNGAVETALGLVSRVVESGFGAANRAADIVSAAGKTAVDQVAAANGRPLAGSLQRYGVWIAGGVLALIGLWLVLRKGK